MPKKSATKKPASKTPEAPETIVRTSPIHGRGLFAGERIPKGTYIGTYEGRRVPKGGRDGKYVLWIYEEDEVCYGVAGKNHMRFINHSARPNAEFQETECYAIRAIKPGDEITFDYGEEWHDEAEA